MKSAGRTNNGKDVEWRTLTRRDLATFDTFATDAVLTAMKLGGVGRIGSKGHAAIRAANGATMMISRDTSAPRCQANVLADLRRTFPDLKTSDQIRKDSAMTSDATTQTKIECPAKGCDQTFPNLGMVNAHVHADHFICKWEGCKLGPDGGPFIARTGNSLAGHTNIHHKGNKPWLANRERAAINRAATVLAKQEARKKAAIEAVKPYAEPVEVPERVDIAEELAVEEHSRLAHEMEMSTTKSGTPLPDLGPLPPATGDAEAKLALIQEILGDDPRVAKLEKEIADLKALLALVREAVGLDFEDGSK